MNILKNTIFIVICLFLGLFSGLSQATIHVSLETVQQSIFPNQKLVQTPVVVSESIRDKMQDASTVRQTFKADHIYKTEKGDWLIVDEVVGKHEMIKYAVGINADGTVRQIEVMDYVESYGYEVAEPKWRQQFVGKTAASTIKLNKDIDNISGATLSCKHLSDGVKRVMVMYDLVLKNHQ
jgi:Na+-translocating ferredoxin:NAD+ oxidoreductase RnfG subunit